MQWLSGGVPDTLDMTAFVFLFFFCIRLREETGSVAAASYRLMEEDIPGVCLNGGVPDDLTVPELKVRLACCGAQRKSKKPEQAVRFEEML